jgi:hypothetical protein
MVNVSGMRPSIDIGVSFLRGMDQFGLAVGGSVWRYRIDRGGALSPIGNLISAVR